MDAFVANNLSKRNCSASDRHANRGKFLSHRLSLSPAILAFLISGCSEDFSDRSGAGGSSGKFRETAAGGVNGQELGGAAQHYAGTWSSATEAGEVGIAGAAHTNTWNLATEGGSAGNVSATPGAGGTTGSICGGGYSGRTSSRAGMPFNTAGTAVAGQATIAPTDCHVAGNLGTWVVSAPSCTGRVAPRGLKAIPTGASPALPTVGDFNLDNKPDLAVASLGDNTIGVLLGNGDGTFAARLDHSYTVGSVASMTVADFDLDGRPDLIVPDAEDGFAVLLGNGDGTFTDGQTFLTGSSVYSTAVADLNLDGRLDIAATHGALLMLALGDIAPTTTLDLEFEDGAALHGVMASDFDRDGNPDLAVMVYSGSRSRVSVVLGNGDGTFGPKTDYLTQFGDSIVVRDFNLDGASDLVVAGNWQSRIGVLLGNGDGSFATVLEVPTDSRSGALAVGDFDQDGTLDLAGVDTILLGNGDGTFVRHGGYSLGRYVSYSPSFYSRGVVVGDFNLDGRPDLAGTNSGDQLNILLGHGDGTFGPGLDYITDKLMNALVVADFDVDGRPDLGVGHQDATIGVFLGNGDGTVAAKVDYATTMSPTSMVVGEFNLDGKPDLATMSRSAIDVLLGHGDGSFAAPRSFGTTAQNCALVTGDFNRDCKSDLAVAYSYTLPIHARIDGAGVNVFLGQGDGSFAALAEYTILALELNVGDFNLDGKPDLATYGKTGDYHMGISNGDVNVLIGNGNGTFGSPVMNPNPDSATRQLVGDLNVDGRPDLVLIDVAAGVTVLLGSGGGKFTTRTDNALMTGFDEGAVEDINRDGKPDLLLIGDGIVRVALGNGDGTFAADGDYSTGAHGPVALGDFDQDGILDWAIANSQSRSLSLFMSTCIP